MKSHEALQMVQQLSHAALQNQTAELSDVLKIMRSDSIQEAEELLKVAETDRKQRESENDQRYTFCFTSCYYTQSQTWDKILLSYSGHL